MALTKPVSNDPGYSGATKASVVIGGIVDAITQQSWSVKAYGGAAGDGVADDTTPIQNTLTAAGVTGGMVFVPPGTYKITARLTVPSGVSVSSAGGATIAPSGNWTGISAVLQNSNITPASTGARDHDITIRDLIFDCSGISSGAPDCIRLTAAYRVKVLNNTILSCPGVGGVGVGRYSAGAINSGDITISGNMVKSSAGQGIYLTSCARAVVSGNLIDTTTLSGIDLEPNANETLTDVVVEANVITATVKAGISLGLSNSGITVNGLTVANNIINSPSDATFGHGIIINAANATGRTLVNGNSITGAAAVGIAYTAGNDVVIAANTVQTSGSYGIRIGSAANLHWAVTGNHVDNTAADAIRVENASAQGTITGNFVRQRGASLSGIRIDAGTAITVTGNAVIHDSNTGSTGIGCTASTPTDIVVVGNRVTGAATGISLGATSGNCLVMANVTIGCTNAYVNNGAATNGIAFYDKAPVAKTTNGIAAAAFVANTSAIANDTATWGGYTAGQVVAALKAVGILT